MFLTGLLTAAMSFGVYLYRLRHETEEMARTHAFAMLVFAELLRAFGARSEFKPVWRITLFSNLWLAVVVAASFALQLWSHHSDKLGRFLHTARMSNRDCAMLLVLSAVPLAVLEVVKYLRIRRREPSSSKDFKVHRPCEQTATELK